MPAMEKPAEDPLGNRPGGDQEASGTSPGERDRTKIAELLADEQCSQAILDFLPTTDVGRTEGPPVANEEEDVASEASEWDSKEREKRLAALREEEERLGV